MTVDKPLIFISYSSFDIDAKEFVRRQLGVLRQVGDIELWHDGEIGVGDDWFQVIEANLQRCDVAILLISADFLGSEFCIRKEVPVLLERRKREGMMIAPILLRPCAWQIVPWLAAIQMQPCKGKPLLALDEIEQAEELTEVVLAIHGFLEKQANQGVITEAKADTPYPALSENAIDLTRLPTSGFDVVGRDKDLQFLNDAFDGTQLNVVSLRAWGGVGKSTLVNKWCDYLAADNYRGARSAFAWSFYSQGTGDGQSGSERVTSADAFIDEALRFFGDQDPTAGSPWAKGERLAELVGKEKALLILDGMEPLQDRHQGIKDPALARLVECLTEKNAGLCVITTREPVKELSDFPETTQEIDLEHLSKEAGRALLRIKGLRTSDDLLEQVSEAFGNHALALNLLASFLRLARRSIQDALKIPNLPDVTVDAGKHPRRVMAAFAKHFGEGPELDLLHIMGLFDRPADAGCITALRGSAIHGLTEKLSTLDEIGWQKLLAKLRRLGLLTESSHYTPDDLDAHPLVREHFGAGLRAQREEAWKAGHERLYEYLKTVPNKHQPDTLAEMAPLFQAIHHGCTADHHKDVYEYLYYNCIMRGGKEDDNAYLLYKLGAFGSHLTILTSLFDRPFTQPSKQLSKQIQSDLLHSAAFNLASLGRAEESIVPVRRAIKISLEIGNFSKAALNASVLSQTEMASGNLQSALSSGSLALEYAEVSDDDQQRLIRRTNLAEAYHHAADFEKSRTLFLEADQINDKYLEEHGAYVRLYVRFGDLLLSLGEPQNALRLAELGIAELRRRWRRLLDIGLIQLIRGRSLSMLDDHIPAQQALDRSVEVLRTSGQLPELPKGLLARAAIFRKMEEYERSRRDLDETKRIAVRCGLRLHECDAHLEYARLALAEGKHDDAVVHFRSAQQLVAACGYHRRDPEIAELKAALNQ